MPDTMQMILNPSEWIGMKKIDKTLHCAVNLYMFMEGISPKKIHEEMVDTSGDNTPYSMAKKWAAEFKW